MRSFYPEVAVELLVEGDLIPLQMLNEGEWDDLFCVTGLSWGLGEFVISGYSLMDGREIHEAVRPGRPIPVFDRS